jgi:hypothetical protein
MIRVVNKKTHKPSKADVYIGRPSPLGNPFTSIQNRKTLAQYMCKSREESIARYKKWILEKLEKGDPAVTSEIKRLKEKVARGEDINLVCWCAPLACHGDVIKEIIE